ncbi:probable ADP-ribosylation factor GTPase-activating protein AGD14 [Hibiscus syriacus]|uniref:probable ADP-ribosylation factor GTPase-activating protein AGD14 n=1 Tax=Hibiscus syriacus TaxID=106335 RepID=UPI00192433B3|nr:probable ADP-ribosylation factor GTPase-activating protein AGD14 [Hibiscus syriacus]
MRDKKKLKDDERIEETIRSLLKLPGNKRCINCNLLGPQYVCTTFSTFVCTTCSGLHREFTHRVKSVSMAKFTEEEASALQAGGNERARQIYFKTWDPQRNSLPNSSDLPMLRNFIKHVYVDKKFTGETIPSPGLRYRAQSPEKKKVIVFTRSKTTLHEGRHEYGGSSPAGAVRVIYTEPRSPRLPQENSRYEFSPRNHRQIEIIDNRRRYDGPGNAIRKDNPSIPQGEHVRSRSSDHLDRVVSPVVRPIRDILEENVPALQKNSSSSSGMESLIDFSMDALPSNAEASPNLLPAPPSSDVGNQTDELSSKGKATPESNANPLDLFLFDLSAPSMVPVDNVSTVPGSAGAPPTASGQNISLNSMSPAIPEGQILALASKKGSSPVPPAINVPQVQSPYGHVFPRMQKHAEQSPRTVEALNNQPGMLLPMHNAQQSSNLSTEQISDATSKSAEETSSKDRVKPLSAETKSSGRRELPQDLFTESYGSSPGAGFDLQFYSNAMPAAGFTSIARPNSFDLNSDVTPAHAPPSPSLASHSSNIASKITPESPFTLAMPSGAYMGNQ